MLTTDKLTWTVIVVILAIAPASATPTETIAQQPNCNNPQSGVEIRYCAARALQAADKRLNQVYQQLISRLSASERQKLIAAELAWIKFRDKNCDFEVRQFVGGTGYPSELSFCLERMTKERTEELERQMQPR